MKSFYQIMSEINEAKTTSVNESDKPEHSTDELVQKATNAKWDDTHLRAALKRPDLTKDHLKTLFKHSGSAYNQVMNHPLVDKKMMHGFADHAHNEFKNDIAQRSVAHKAKEMGVKHPLVDKYNKGEIKAKVLNLGSGPARDYGKKSGGWTGD